MITIREYKKQDMAQAMEIWNEVVREGVAFPQLDELTEQTADEFFTSQSYTGIAEETDTVATTQCMEINNNTVCCLIILQSQRRTAIAKQRNPAFVLHRTHAQRRVAHQQQCPVYLASCQQVASYGDGIHTPTAAHRYVYTKAVHR